MMPQPWLALSPVYYLERQLAAESARQRGWRKVCASSGEPAERLPRGGELVFGPPGAHLVEPCEGAA
jgi:hypothetical protein